MALTVERNNGYGIGIGKRFQPPQAIPDHRIKVIHNVSVLTDQSFVASIGRSFSPRLFNLVGIKDGLIVSCGQACTPDSPEDSVLLIGNHGNPGNIFEPVSVFKGDGSVPDSVLEALRQVPFEKYNQ